MKSRQLIGGPFLLLCCVATAMAGDRIAGRVVDVDIGKKSVGISINSEQVPSPGDPFEIFVEVEGVGRVDVAKGRLTSAKQGLATGDIASADGQIRVGQLVSIELTKPSRPPVGTTNQDNTPDPVPTDKDRPPETWLGMSRCFFDGRELILLGVLPGSPAEKAGLQANDKIVSVDDTAFAMLEQFHQLIDHRRPDEQVEIQLLRNGRPKTISITMQGIPSDGGTSQYRQAAEKGLSWAMTEMGLRYAHIRSPDPHCPHDNQEAVRWFQQGADAGDDSSRFFLAFMHETGRGCEQDPLKARKMYEQIQQRDRDTTIQRAVYFYATKRLVEMYLTGRGGPKDSSGALRLLHEAAKEGVRQGQNRLGEVLHHGLAGPADTKEAARWFRLAAEAGLHKAQYNLGVIYMQGLAGEKDLDEAARWLALAVDQEFVPAFNLLGLCFLNGSGVPKDASEAARYFRHAADAGNANAQLNLGSLLEHGRGTSQDYAQAAKYYRLAADKGLASAQNALGWLFQHGRGVPQDDVQAIELYRKAAKQNNATAQTNLGVMYHRGRGTTQDYAQALNWYRKAADQGFANAETNLGIMYRFGLGVTKNRKQAIQWYTKAAKKKNATAQLELGLLSMEGNPTRKNYEISLAWFKLAAAQGNALAQTQMGFLYQNGLGIEQDLDQAIVWYRLAAAQGEQQAINNLEAMGINP